MKKRMTKAAGILMAALMFAGNALPVSATDIDAVQQEARQLENQKNAAVAEQQALAEQLNTIMADMKETEAQMARKAAEIEEAENDLVTAKVEENTQYESMKKRIRYMYENGNTEFIEILITAKDISDFLNKAEYVTRISEYDRNMLEEFKEVVRQVEEKEASLKSDYEQLGVLQEQLTGQRSQVETLVAEKGAEISSLESAIGEKNAELQALIEKARQAEELRRQQEEAARQQQQQQNNQSSQGQQSSGGSSSNHDTSSGSSSQQSGGSSSNGAVSGGSFVHPCPSGHVSSGFGYRDFDKSFHKGVDFGTSGAYVPTYAAASGRVLIAGWSNSAGNWVVIDHGNGLVTKYMHHSSLLVSQGQHVSAGQQIGVTGNTGNSAGVHLHFQVELDGRAVNPFNYL